MDDPGRASLLEDRARRYAGEMMAFAARWSAAAPESSSRAAPPSAIESVRPRTADEIAARAKETAASPSRIDALALFARFLGYESHSLRSHAGHPGLLLQLAFNSADAGPVAAAAESMIGRWGHGALLLRESRSRPAFEPHPALQRTLVGHRGPVSCVAISYDGRLGVSGGDDGKLRCWDLASGLCTQTLPGHAAGIRAVEMTPDGRRAVSLGRDAALRRWDLETGACLGTLESLSDSVTCFAITPDARLVVSERHDSSIPSKAWGLQVWDLESLHPLRTIELSHYEWIESIGVTADGRRAVTPERIIDLERGDSGDMFVDRARRSGAFGAPHPSGLRLTPDGATVVGLSGEGLVAWDLDEPTRPPRAMSCEGSAAAECLDVTHDGKRAASGHADGRIRLWDLESGAEVRSLPGHVGAVTGARMTPDGRWLISGGADGAVRSWELELGAPSPGTGAAESPALALGPLPESGRLIAAHADGTVRRWNLDARRSRTLGRHSRAANCVAVTPDGDRAVSGGDDCALRVWDVAAGECRGLLEGHTLGVDGLCLGAGGALAVSGGLDRALRLWRLEPGELLSSFREHPEGITSLALTPDERWAVTGCRDGVVRVWDLRSGECIRPLHGHRGAVECVAVTADGRRILSGGADSEIRVWRPDDGECVRVLAGHRGKVVALGASRDGARCCSAGADQTLRLWEVATGACLAIHPTVAAIRSLATAQSPSGFLYSDSQGQIVELRSVDLAPARGQERRERPGIGGECP